MGRQDHLVQWFSPGIQLVRQGLERSWQMGHRSLEREAEVIELETWGTYI